jgi:hypothetical protein
MGGFEGFSPEEIAEHTGGEKPRKKGKRRGSAEYLEPLLPKGDKFDPLVLDIESKSGPSASPGFVRPFLVGLWDGETFLAFRNDVEAEAVPWRRRHFAPGGCIDNFMRVLLALYPGRRIYAHNGGGFDFLFLFAWLRRHPEYCFQVVPVQSSILRIDVWSRSSKSPKKDAVSFLDSMRLLPMGLDKACKSFGVKGKTTETSAEHYALMHLPEEDPRWEVYLRGDCVALRSVLLKFHELLARLGGDVATTTPATAMRLYRIKYLPKSSVTRIARHSHWSKCKQKRCQGCLHEWLRTGYKGGRVEIFTMRGSGLHYYDFNSSYPAVLRLPMPVGAKIEAFGQLDWTMLERGFVGFVECEVFIPPSCNVPPLPFEKDNKLVFPTGRFSGVWDADELKELYDPAVKGMVTKVRRVVWYKAVPIFKPMIEELYKLRQRLMPDGVTKCVCEKARPKPNSCPVCGFEVGISELAKLLLNSFYGKFGMDPNREMILILDDDEKRENLPYGAKPSWHPSDPASGMMADVWYAPTFADADYIVPQIAAHVTALARRALWKEMVRISTTKVVTQACKAIGEERAVDGEDVLCTVRGIRVKVADVHVSSELQRAGDEGMLVTQHIWTKEDKEKWGDGVKQDITVPRERGRGACVGVEDGEMFVLLEMNVRRSHLHPDSQVRNVGDEGEVSTWGQLFYADTDSIITNATIASSSELGELKVEYDGDLIDFVSIQPKGYKSTKHSTGDTEIKFKGLPKAERTERGFQKMLDGKTVSYKRLGKLRTLAGQDFWPSPSMVEVDKSVKSIYDKRVLRADGTTGPLCLDGEQIVSPERFARVAS